MEESQSQDQVGNSKLNYYLVRKAYDRIGRKYKLTGIAPFIISFHINEIFCATGNIIDLSEERFDGLETYREELDISTIGEVSRAFSVLVKKNVFIQWKVKGLLHRKLHPEFIEALKDRAEKLLARKLTSQKVDDTKLLAHKLSPKKIRDNKLLAPQLSPPLPQLPSGENELAPKLFPLSSPAKWDLAPQLSGSYIEELAELTDPNKLAGINSRASTQPIGEKVVSFCKRFEKMFDMGKKPGVFFTGNMLWMEDKLIGFEDDGMNRFFKWCEDRRKGRFYKFSPELRDSWFEQWGLDEMSRPQGLQNRSDQSEYPMSH